jgi:hypothetical protein
MKAGYEKSTEQLYLELCVQFAQKNKTLKWLQHCGKYPEKSLN